MSDITLGSLLILLVTLVTFIGLLTALSVAVVEYIREKRQKRHGGNFAGLDQRVAELASSNAEILRRLNDHEKWLASHHERLTALVPPSPPSQSHDTDTGRGSTRQAPSYQDTINAFDNQFGPRTTQSSAAGRADRFQYDEAARRDLQQGRRRPVDEPRTWIEQYCRGELTQQELMARMQQSSLTWGGIDINPRPPRFEREHFEDVLAFAPAGNNEVLAVISEHCSYSVGLASLFVGVDAQSGQKVRSTSPAEAKVRSDGTIETRIHGRLELRP